MEGDSLRSNRCCKKDITTLIGQLVGCPVEQARNMNGAKRPQMLPTPEEEVAGSWTTRVDIARPRDRAITFVARGAKSGAVRSSFRTSGS